MKRKYGRYIVETTGKKGGSTMKGAGRIFLVLAVCAFAATGIVPRESMAGAMQDKGTKEGTMMKEEGMMKETGTMTDKGMTEDKTMKEQGMAKDKGMMEDTKTGGEKMMEDKGTMK